MITTMQPEKLMAGINAVINLHTDVQTGPRNRGKSGLRPRCTECGFAYPCPTIQIIETTLA
jgi:hypothetical protein